MIKKGVSYVYLQFLIVNWVFKEEGKTKTPFNLQKDYTILHNLGDTLLSMEDSFHGMLLIMEALCLCAMLRIKRTASVTQ